MSSGQGSQRYDGKGHGKWDIFFEVAKYRVVYFNQYLLQGDSCRTSWPWLQYLLHPRHIILVLSLATGILYISQLQLNWPSLWKHTNWGFNQRVIILAILPLPLSLSLRKFSLYFSLLACLGINLFTSIPPLPFHVLLHQDESLPEDIFLNILPPL